MLGNYALYKKLEEHTDNKISELKRENIFTIGKAILPLIIVYIYKSYDKTISIYLFLLFLLIMLIICFKPARRWISEPIIDTINTVKFIFGRPFAVKDYQKKLSSFDDNFHDIIKELATLKIILTTTTPESLDLYIFLTKDELENYKKVFFNISRVLKDGNKYQVNNTNDAKVKLNTAINYYCDFVDQFTNLSSQEDFLCKISDHAQLYLKDIQSYSFQLRQISNDLNIK